MQRGSLTPSTLVAAPNHKRGHLARFLRVAAGVAPSEAVQIEKHVFVLMLLISCL